MDYCNRNYLSFFFTHEVQEVTPSGIQNWIDAVRPGRNFFRPTDVNQNALYAQIGDDEEIGRAVISATEAEFYLDCSSQLPVSSDKIDTSRTYIDIASYEFSTSLPIRPSIALMDLFFFYENMQIELPTPLPNSDEQGNFAFLNPWWSEDRVFCPKPRELTTTYFPLTVDSTEDSVDQNFTTAESTALVQLSFTADLAFTVLEQEYDPNEYDLVKRQRPRHEINLERVPFGQIKLEYVSNDSSVKSRTNVRLKGRGYVPSETFGESMQGATLSQTGIGILGLLANNNTDLVYSALEELVYHWSVRFNNTVLQDGKYYINPDGFGVLPDFLHKNAYAPPVSQIPSSRKTKEIAWLVFAVVQAIKLFKNRPPQTRHELPENLDLFLRHHLFYLASYTDPGTGWVVQAINDFGIATDTRDIETLVISHLAMTESLSILYDSFVHQRAAVSYLKAKELIGVPRPEDFEEIALENQADEKFKAFAAKLLFDYRYGIQRDIPSVIEAYINLVGTEGTLPKNLSLFTSILGNIPIEQTGLSSAEYSYWNFNSFFTEVQPGLYRSKREITDNPSLEISAWGNITNSGFNIFADEPFNLHAEEADAYTSYAYQNAKRMWPTGYRWTALEFELARQGVVGSILFAIAKQTFAWFLQYSIFKNGRFISSAQGWTVDRWAGSVGYERPYLQSDTYALRSIRNRYLSTPSDFRSVVNSLNRLFENVDNPDTENSILIRQPNFPEVVDFTAPSTYSSRPWTGSPEDVRSVLNAGGHPDFDEPGFLLPPTEGESEPSFTPWLDIAPRLEIDAFGFHPNLKNEINNIAPYGVGLNVNLILAFRSFEYADADINVTVFDIGTDPDACYLALGDDVLSVNFSLLAIDGACCLEGIELDNGDLWITDSNQAIKADGFDCFVESPPDPDPDPVPDATLVFLIEETQADPPIVL